MTDEQTTPEGDQQTDTAPVRVPNVSPGARSGIDHEVIGSNAQAAYDTNKDLFGDGPEPETPDGTEKSEDSPVTGGPSPTDGQGAPDGESLDDALTRLRGIEDDAERKAAADEVWTAHKDGGPEDLAQQITAAVYGTGDQGSADPADDDGTATTADNPGTQDGDGEAQAPSPGQDADTADTSGSGTGDNTSQS